jgi:hypothetical protein
MPLFRIHDFVPVSGYQLGSGWGIAAGKEMMKRFLDQPFVSKPGARLSVKCIDVIRTKPTF